MLNGRTKFLPMMIAVIGLSILEGHSAAWGQPTSNTPRQECWMTNGDVHAAVQNCNTLYLGGSFTRVRPYTGTFAVLDKDTGQPELGLPPPNYTCYAGIPDGSGGWYIGGGFTSVGESLRGGVARIREDGTLDSLFAPIVSGGFQSVQALAINGNTLFVGGSFTSINNQGRNNIAAFDTVSGDLLDWNPNVVGGDFTQVKTMAIYESTLYIGGTFTHVGGQPRNHVAAIDANSGDVKNWVLNVGNSLSPNVWTLAVTDDVVYVGGNFDQLSGLSRQFIGAASRHTGSVTGWNPQASGTVSALAVDGNNIIAGGLFDWIGWAFRNRIAALSASTGLATNWNPNIDGGDNFTTVLAICADKSAIYVAGSFASVGGNPRQHLAGISRSTGAPISWNPGASYPVWSMVRSEGRIGVGGDFDSVGGHTRNRLAAIDVSTGGITSWNPDANSTVRALDSADAVIYAGGDFTNVGSQPRNRIAAIDQSGNPVNGWDPGANGSVLAIASSGSAVYLGGSFTTVGGQSRNRIAAVDSGGTLVAGWDPNATGIVRAISLYGSSLIVGGDFNGTNSIGGANRNRIAALNLINGQATTWNPNANGAVRAIAAAGDTIYVGGDFNGTNSIGGANRSRIAALNASNNMATTWNPGANGSVNALAVAGNSILVGGAFSGTNSIGGANRNRLAALNRLLNTNNALSWDPNANSTVNAVLVTSNAVYAGGDFTTIGGQSRQYLAAFSSTNIDWNGGSGLWNVEANWNPPEVPDNVDCQTYDVRVAGATSSVLVNINPTINSLTLENGAAVNVDAGSLTFVTPLGIINDGSVNVTNGFELIAGSPMKIGGTMPVTLATGGLASNDPAHVITLTTPVTGHGQITAAINNQSTIEANSFGQSLDISGSLPATSDGILRAVDGGTLQINRSIGGAGAYVASGGTISIPGGGAPTIGGGSVNIHNGGQVAASGDALVSIIGHVSLDCNEGFTLGCSPPILVMGGDSTLDIGGDLNLFGTVNVNIGSSAFVNLAHHFNNQSTSPTTFQWESGRLTLDGSGVQTFELAGQDFGDSDPAGFLNNFAMGELRIAPGRTVHFVNAFDNVPGPGCEVLYVDTLILEPGSTIVLDGCNVYYRQLANNGATVTLLNGAELSSALIGDMTCDNQVNGEDIAAFILAIMDPIGYEQAHPDCPILHADLNQSKGVDLADVPGFVALLLGGS